MFGSGRARAIIVAIAIAAALLLCATPIGSAAPQRGGPTDTAPVPSMGCKAAPVPPGTSLQLFSAAGRSGDYLREVPALAKRTPMPVVFDIHGYLQPGAIQAAWSGMGPYGARHGFAVITPETHVLPPQWDFGENGRDIAFLSALLTHVEKTLCLDKRRIYVTGLSMGAFTTSSIACQLADRFAAAAPVSGIQNFQWCNPSRPVPVVAFHGTGDKILSYSGGLGPHGLLLPALDGSPRTIGQQLRDGPVPTTMPRSETVRSQTAAWAKRNGCSSKTTARRITHDVTRTQWSCRADGAAELYTIHGGGHNWPGGDPLLAFTPITGPITSSISATRIIWDFFRAHPITGPIHT
ncbi:hypothetical protein GII33_03225 [Gordonia pseudamarae]|jgi:polyhydroxybutyrate depolymerase|uniref:Polyhydroxybutyrate depolymerase n=1 Tax=Gordonia pseudamarae TaxID=2831662 RepID=A0ABX6IFG5_9ACTN|nr:MULTISPECIES: PHB depolymerase family esterase [Gordonia]MBD0021586.1 hypothetical protein [Gordonia sp. (in: high G+C Gram-positive bacteria)]QHN25131.1 hypothetical protein GII33_03225 [Gordonia pseudamarae]QHN34064.1 hypothetical protein GII31_03220 [Gordonia pseudamarae]